MKNKYLKRGYLMRTKRRRNQFTFYSSYYYAVLDLPASRRFEALEALIRYALEGEEPEGLKGSARAFFKLVKPNLDSSRSKAEAALRKSRAGEPEAFQEAFSESEGEGPFSEAGEADPFSGPQEGPFSKAGEADPFSRPLEGPFSKAGEADPFSGPQEGPFFKAGEADPFSKPQEGNFSRQQEKKAQKTESEKKTEQKPEPETEGEKERETENEIENEIENEKEGSARDSGHCRRPAAAEGSADFSLPKGEKEKLLLKTPLIGRPPYAAMFREDPMLLYCWRDLAEEEGRDHPIPTQQQQALLSELLPLPAWERPAHLMDRLRDTAGSPKKTGRTP